jgi:hypothetical protein
MADSAEVGGRTRLRRMAPYAILIPVAVLLGLAPFRPEPHLVEKTGMLLDGTLRRPIDIFDLVLHGSPVALLIVRVMIDVAARVTGKHPESSAPA